MRRTGGGTKMWCPACEEIQVCKAIPVAEITSDPKDYAQRWHSTTHADIHWFQRGRECLECEHVFITAECLQVFLDELTELRDALSDIKVNAEKFVAENQKVAASLARLNSSLSVLKALKIYRAT